MPDRGLQGIEAVVQRQKRVPPERDDHRLICFRHDGGPRLLRPGLPILDRLALAPLGTVLGLMPSSLLSAASEACDRCIAARTACVVVALT